MVLLMLSTAIAVLCDFSRVPVSILPLGISLRALLGLLNPHRSLSLVMAEWAIRGLGIIWNFITTQLPILCRYKLLEYPNYEKN